MEIKKWNEYSKEERIKLLKHWWSYFGRDSIGDKEFDQLITLRTDEMFEVAVISFMHGNSIRTLLASIIRGDVDSYINYLIMNFSGEVTLGVRREFIERLVTTYNNSVLNQLPRIYGLAKEIMNQPPEVVGGILSEKLGVNDITLISVGDSIVQINVGDSKKKTRNPMDDFHKNNT